MDFEAIKNDVEWRLSVQLLHIGLIQSTIWATFNTQTKVREPNWRGVNRYWTIT